MERSWLVTRPPELTDSVEFKYGPNAEPNFQIYRIFQIHILELPDLKPGINEDS